jgi:hypothetical protein
MCTAAGRPDQDSEVIELDVNGYNKGGAAIHLES